MSAPTLAAGRRITITAEAVKAGHVLDDGEVIRVRTSRGGLVYITVEDAQGERCLPAMHAGEPVVILKGRR